MLMIEKITNDDIQLMTDQLREVVAASTLLALCCLLKSILNSAVRKNIISANPYQEIKLPRLRRKPKVLSIGEQKRLERTAFERGALKYLVFMYTGIRLGELCALRYGDIDFESNILYISHSVKRVSTTPGSLMKTRLAVGLPKTENSIREIPLLFFLAKMLEDRMWSQKATPEHFIFKGASGTAAEP